MHRPNSTYIIYKIAYEFLKLYVDYIVLVLAYYVDRGHIEDGRTLELIKNTSPDMLVECLVSDFEGEG